jgi:hypothetical protein
MQKLPARRRPLVLKRREARKQTITARMPATNPARTTGQILPGKFPRAQPAMNWPIDMRKSYAADSTEGIPRRSMRPHPEAGTLKPSARASPRSDTRSTTDFLG